MAIVTVGIDLAKNAFALHGVDATGIQRLEPISETQTTALAGLVMGSP